MPAASTTTDRRFARLAWGILLAAAACAAGIPAVESASAELALSAGAGVLPLTAGLVALRLRFGCIPLTWALFLAGAGCWVLGDLLASLADAAGTDPGFPSVIDAVYVAGYPLMLGGIVVGWRRRTRDGLGAFLDAAIFATSIGLFVWAIVIDAPSATASDQLFATLYPTLDTLIVVQLAQLMLVPGLARNRSVQLLLAGSAVFLAGDVLYAHEAVRGTYLPGGPHDLTWLAAYALWGVAAVHPASRRIATAPPAVIAMTTRRLAALGAACLLVPVALYHQATAHGVNAGVFAVSGALLILLVFGRTATIFNEQRRAAQELHDSRELYRALVEETGDLVTLVGPDDRIVFASPSHEELLEIGPEWLVDRPFTDLAVPSDREKLLDALGALRAGRDPGTAEFRLCAPGEHRWGEARFTLLGRGERSRPLVLATTRDVTERRRALDALAESTRRLQTLVETAPVAILATDSDRRLTLWNPGAERLFGWTAEEVLGGPSPIVPAPDLDSVLQQIAAGETVQEEAVRTRKDGTSVEVIVHAAPLLGPSGEVVGTFAVIVDLSERKRLEAELRQAQKMEAVGQLAGGIAHDFNNLLTAITGYVGLALGRVEDDEKLRRDLGEVARASDRAADLTRQLLAFSRRQVLQPATFDLNEAVRETSGLLSRLLGEHIRVVTSLDPAGCPILADRGQVEQVLMNLAVNARDAQPEGGTLAIETETVTLDGDAAGPELAAGRYVALRVSDTGSGMDAVTARHAFEPFFTTKEPGQGTGLGLATVYGIVSQSGGRIRMSSTPGAGTTFEILLPRSDPRPAAPPEERVEAPPGTERILLVEDERIVRELTCEMLEQRGYDVICAARPDEALELAAREEVDLLLTDVVMPEMNGPSLASILRRARPDLPVLFTSGYTADARLYGDGDGTAQFLQKPYSAGELAAAVRTTLDARTQTGRPEGRPVDSA